MCKLYLVTTTAAFCCALWLSHSVLAAADQLLPSPSSTVSSIIPKSPETISGKRTGRQMMLPPGQDYGGGYPAAPVDPYGGGYGPPPQPQQMQYGYQPPQDQYGGQPPAPYQQPSYGYQDPGFSVQTGYEGFLVPNSWAGSLPMAIQGLVIVGALVLVFAIVMGIAWFTGFADFAMVKEQARSYIPSSFGLPSKEYLNELSDRVLSAVDRYNELLKKKD